MPGGISKLFRFSRLYILTTSTECKTLKGERRMIFIFNIITALNYNQDRESFVLVVKMPCRYLY